MNNKEFPCTACGKCCKNVALSSETTFLDRGDSICKNFNEDTNLCNIYSQRPLVCRVEDYYDTFLSDKYNWDDFVEINLIICENL